MASKKHKAVIAFSAGASGMLFLILFSSLVEIPIPDPDNLLVFILWAIVVIGFVEEGIKFLLVSRWGKFPYYCIFLGLGYAFSEIFFRDVLIIISIGSLRDLLGFTFWFKRSFGFVIQVILAVTIAYFIKENKPIFGLVSTALIHAGMDVLLFI